MGQIVAKYPDVEILVNNLGIFEPKPFEQIPDADWFRFFEVNVLSGVRLSRHYLPRMKERNWGRIVFISSESALQIPHGNDSLRHDQDRAVGHFARPGRDHRRHQRHRQYRSARPHRFRRSRRHLSNRWPPRERSAAKKWRRSSSALCVHRHCSSASPRVDEVAAMVAYVCSPVSSATNGAALRVDGGVVQSIA